ncbi:4-hydroxy-2-oxovalerate aldolase [Candidatus Uhrbacteria bacterium]|nr:MAG: 4-hydroxy-2-oxovalerate aldolase [Candidatus Uhrbacteria bacterium]
MKKHVTILDTTLRDGSYEVDFSFTVEQTRAVCRELEAAGVELIEIGHGVGLNASVATKDKAVHADEEYLRTAQETLTRSKFGMFCIPGIACLEDVDLAGKYGMGFIRIGTDVERVPHSEPFIKKAKSYGMLVAANYMKSYAATPEQFAERVKESESYGADIVYIVDSAGGMFPEDIERYVKAIRHVSDIALGFHGHDNLGMAIANTIAAAELGVTYLDASLQGLGRSAGNAVTEVLAAALIKRGYGTGVDLLKLFETGQAHILPILRAKGRRPIDITSGFAEFHSSFLPQILDSAKRHEIDPKLLIIEMCKLDKVRINQDLLEETAQKIRANHAAYGFGR